jgi:hypothetical protein
MCATLNNIDLKYVSFPRVTKIDDGLFRMGFTEHDTHLEKDCVLFWILFQRVPHDF